MAKDSDDCEPWLLPQFLTDDVDELFAEFKINSKNNRAIRNGNKGCSGLDFQQHEFGYGFGPFGTQSGLSSPVEGSTEAESDDDDYINGLTKQLAQSTLQDSALPYEHNNKRGFVLSGSPQSTLCSALCGGCGCNHGSSLGSPNCASQVASPLGVNRNEAAWHLLYAAAGEVARMRMMEGAAAFHPDKNGPLSKPSPIPVPQRIPSPNLGFRSDHPTYLSYQHHLKAAQFEQLKQQMVKQQQGMDAWGQGKFQLSQTQQMILNRVRTGGGKSSVPMNAWPTLDQSQRQQQQQQQQPQQHPGSGMRAVFLGNPCSKRECAGTGVFLPRRFGNPADTRKKSACSTVLLPDRVVQALNLNLNLETVDAPAQPRYTGGPTTDYDAAAAAMRYRNCVAMAQQRRSARQQPELMSQVQEFKLPQEWSY